jgi:hypothetical protein
MRDVVLDGFYEARIGYITSQSVFDAMKNRWYRAFSEFKGICEWAAKVVEGADDKTLKRRKAKSDRLPGTDSRLYDYLINEALAADDRLVTSVILKRLLDPTPGESPEGIPNLRIMVRYRWNETTALSR